MERVKDDEDEDEDEDEEKCWLKLISVSCDTIGAAPLSLVPPGAPFIFFISLLGACSQHDCE